MSHHNANARSCWSTVGVMLGPCGGPVGLLGRLGAVSGRLLTLLERLGIPCVFEVVIVDSQVLRFLFYLWCSRCKCTCTFWFCTCTFGACPRFFSVYIRMSSFLFGGHGGNVHVFSGFVHVHLACGCGRPQTFRGGVGWVGGGRNVGAEGGRAGMGTGVWTGRWRGKRMGEWEGEGGPTGALTGISPAPGVSPRA